MKITDRQQLAQDIFNECLEVLLKKGKDYSGEDDCLSNFKESAQRLGLTKYQVWGIYFDKHLRSLLNSVKYNPQHPQVESEPIRSRVVDIINYAIIFYALNEEDMG